MRICVGRVAATPVVGQFKLTHYRHPFAVDRHSEGLI